MFSELLPSLEICSYIAFQAVARMKTLFFIPYCVRSQHISTRNTSHKTSKCYDENNILIYFSGQHYNVSPLNSCYSKFRLLIFKDMCTIFDEILHLIP